MAATLVAGLRGRGLAVRVRLGFGTIGFLSELDGLSRFMGINPPFPRKLFYPLWLLLENLRTLALLTGPTIVWLNAVYAVPAALPILLIMPRRAIIHVHENRIPGPLMRLIAWAGRRGATVLAVSAHHRRMLGLPAILLPNAVGDGEPPDPPRSRDRLVFVGTASAMKGWPLFLEIVRRLDVPGLQPHAFLAGGIDAPSADAVAEGEALGILVTVGQSDPAQHHARGFLALQLTDPALAEETFSLVAAEAVWHLVPVGGAGAAVLPEVAGDALAFNIASRDPQAIAEAIGTLWASPDRYQSLVVAAARQRLEHRADRFAERALAIAEAALV